MDVRLAVADGGAEVRIVAGAETVAVIDAKSLQLSEPSLPAPPPAAARNDGSAPSCSQGRRASRSFCGGAGGWSRRSA